MMKFDDDRYILFMSLKRTMYGIVGSFDPKTFRFTPITEN